jgi:hypothetical protein
MRGRPLLLVPALAALACLILAGCTAGATSSAARRTTASSSQRAATSAHVAGRIGSPGNPLMLTCAEESFPLDPAFKPGPGDLVIGPLIIANGKLYANVKPVDHGGNKIPFIVLPGRTVTVTIGAQERGHVWIDNPYAQINWGIRLVAAATYHACSPQAIRQGFFVQGFAFTSGPLRACLPLDVRIGHQVQVRHITLSLFAGSCPP